MGSATDQSGPKMKERKLEQCHYDPSLIASDVAKRARGLGVGDFLLLSGLPIGVRGCHFGNSVVEELTQTETKDVHNSDYTGVSVGCPTDVNPPGEKLVSQDYLIRRLH